jgi:hypothetical protein
VARHAKMQISTGGDRSTVVISLIYADIQPGIPFAGKVQWWSCLPGYLNATHGYWRDKWLGPGSLDFYDEDDGYVATAMDLKPDLIGYPLSDHAGQEGRFLAFHGGKISRWPLTWKLISV